MNWNHKLAGNYKKKMMRVPLFIKRVNQSNEICKEEFGGWNLKGERRNGYAGTIGKNNS